MRRILVFRIRHRLLTPACLPGLSRRAGTIRNIFVYHNDGQTTMDWYLAIRNAKLNYLRVAFPGQSAAEVSLLPALPCRGGEAPSLFNLISNFQLT